jgi:hypothetical protein
VIRLVAVVQCARWRLPVLAVLVPVLSLAGATTAEAATLRITTTKDEMR